jgi:hypothetical protein
MAARFRTITYYKIKGVGQHVRRKEQHAGRADRWICSPRRLVWLTPNRPLRRPGTDRLLPLAEHFSRMDGRAGRPAKGADPR